MRASRATVSADCISRWCTFGAVVGCGVLVFFVALPLAVSSPFPTPKGHEWITDASPVHVATREPMGRELEAAIDTEEDTPEAESVKEAALPEAEAPAPAAARTGWPRVLDPTPLIEADPEPTGSLPAAAPAAPAARSKVADVMDEVDEYLWQVYRRAPVKRDSSGDFTWKDPAAAKRMGVSLKAYVIGGMDRDFREQLFHAGKAMDAAGLDWAILSAFRDDYRQRLASGFKARAGNSLHGGSRRTGGYGHGRAIDVTSTDGEPERVWRWLDAHGAKYGLSRPMPGYDPAHIQTRGNWHSIAIALRAARGRLARSASAGAE